MTNMRNLPEPEFEENECVDAQGNIFPEHKIPLEQFEDGGFCVRCYAEMMPEESEE